MLQESDCRLDRGLAEWFSRRGGPWSGTAGELLASLETSAEGGHGLLPQSSGELCAHLQSHKQVLQSLGVDVLLGQGLPRMVSIRPCPDGQPQRTPPSNTSYVDRKADLAIDLPSRVIDQKSCSTDSVRTGPVGCEESHRDRPEVKIDSVDSAERFVTGPFAAGVVTTEGLFVNTGEALFAIVEMRRQIREQALDLEAAVDLVISRARQITRSCGIAVGFLPEQIGHLRTEVVTSGAELDFHGNIFQSRLGVGDTVQLPDAQKHPLLGATFRREGIGSLIMVPIFRGREVAGALEFLFPEKRSFSSEDVMDLGLFAAVISESLGGAKPEGGKRIRGLPPETQTVTHIEPPGPLLRQEADPREGSLRPGRVAPDSKSQLTESPNPRRLIPTPRATNPVPGPIKFWIRLKRTWMRHIRGIFPV